ncbi:50S ribosomal protein L23 [Gammaproteobacteria bacterium]|nr:50S ribosomal protein L23 [Gammaproteobacteria bacterium]
MADVNPTYQDYRVIQKMLETEKTLKLEGVSQYVFRVCARADKQKIAKAVASIFHVTVVAVNTMNVKRKTKRTRHGIGIKNGWKKAYVTLKGDQTLQMPEVKEV